MNVAMCDPDLVGVNCVESVFTAPQITRRLNHQATEAIPSTATSAIRWFGLGVNHSGAIQTEEKSPRSEDRGYR